jgi:hypothetical protein
VLEGLNPSRFPKRNVTATDRFACRAGFAAICAQTAMKKPSALQLVKAYFAAYFLMGAACALLKLLLIIADE